MHNSLTRFNRHRYESETYTPPTSGQKLPSNQVSHFCHTDISLREHIVDTAARIEVTDLFVLSVDRRHPKVPTYFQQSARSITDYNL